jgi:hypothetical protein
MLRAIGLALLLSMGVLLPAGSNGVGAQQIGVDPYAVRREVKAAERQAELERVKRIERDAARIVQLAAAVKVESANGPSTEASAQKLEQIEALAGDLKRRVLKEK